MLVISKENLSCGVEFWMVNYLMWSIETKVHTHVIIKGWFHFNRSIDSEIAPMYLININPFSAHNTRLKYAAHAVCGNASVLSVNCTHWTPMCVPRTEYTYWNTYTSSYRWEGNFTQIYSTQSNSDILINERKLTVFLKFTINILQALNLYPNDLVSRKLVFSKWIRPKKEIGYTTLIHYQIAIWITHDPENLSSQTNVIELSTRSMDRYPFFRGNLYHRKDYIIVLLCYNFTDKRSSYLQLSCSYIQPPR